MTLHLPAREDRERLADVVARVVRLDPEAVVRLRDGAGQVALWASTPFEVLVAAGAPGSVTPADVTVVGSDLLAALSVVATPEVDPGRPVDDRWRRPLPPADVRWRELGAVAAAEAETLAAAGIEAARGADPTGEPSRDLLDAVATEVDGVRVPMRCLLALAGLGWPAGPEPVAVAMSADGAWLRLAAGGAAIVRRRRPELVLRPA